MQKHYRRRLLGCGMEELDDAAALDDAQKDGNDGHHQEEVDEASDGVRGDHSQEPEQNHDDDDRFEHIDPFLSGR
jgi:hypothetical protein